MAGYDEAEFKLVMSVDTAVLKKSVFAVFNVVRLRKLRTVAQMGMTSPSIMMGHPLKSFVNNILIEYSKYTELNVAFV